MTPARHSRSIPVQARDRSIRELGVVITVKVTDIGTTGVVGGGTMGFGIALNFALAGYKTLVTDMSEHILGRTLERVRDALALFVDEGMITRAQVDQTLARVETTPDLAAVAGRSDFITEAIVESLPAKQALFRTLDRLCPPHTILVSNTSGFVLSDVAEGVERQDKVALTHYFAPPHIVPGVEVAKGPATSQETFDVTCQLMQRAGKVPIRVLKEISGYLLNRIQGAMNREALRLWAMGVATAEEIELGIRSTFGFRLPNCGPFAHHDLAGLWRWPPETRVRKPPRMPDAPSEEEMQAMIAARATRPWFIDPEEYDAAVARRDRAFVRAYKTFYCSRLGNAQESGD